MKKARSGVLSFGVALLLPPVATAQTDVPFVCYPLRHRYAKGDEWFGADKAGRGSSEP